MSKRNIFIGLIFILIGAWIYTAMSTFKEVPGSSPTSIVIREGVERGVDEIAKALSDEMGFDLEGAYKSGYTPGDVVEYLMKQPHKRSISYFQGKFYEGRITILRIIPFSICIILFLIGVAILIFKWKKEE